MRKTAVAMFGFIILAYASNANAIPVDSATARLCKQGSAFGDDWDPNTSPHCVCGKGEGDKERVNLSFPGQKYKNMVAKYGDYRDRCAMVSEIKHAPKVDKPKAEDKPKIAPPVPPPSCSLAQSQIDAKANEPALNMLICTGAVSRINKIIASCDNCKAPDEEKVKLSKADDSYNYRVKVTAEPGIKSSLVSVNVVGKSMNSQLTYKVSWEISACAKQPSGGTDANGTCLCPAGKHVTLNSDGQPICEKDEPKAVEPPKPAPVKVVEVKQVPVKGEKGEPGASAPSRIHPLVQPECLYAKSKIFHTRECMLGLGLTADILQYLKWYGIVSLGAPGATRTDSDAQPIILANGKPDKRNYSGKVESGLMLQLIGPLGARAGIFRRMDGLTDGLVNPVYVTTGGLIGLDFTFQVDKHSLGFGIDGGCGSQQKGSMGSHSECSVGLNLRFEAWTGNGK